MEGYQKLGGAPGPLAPLVPTPMLIAMCIVKVKVAT